MAGGATLRRGVSTTHEFNSRHTQTALGGASLRRLQGCGRFGPERLRSNSKRKRSRKQVPAFGKRHAYGGQDSRCPKYGRVRVGFALVRKEGTRRGERGSS